MYEGGLLSPQNEYMKEVVSGFFFCLSVSTFILRNSFNKRACIKKCKSASETDIWNYVFKSIKKALQFLNQLTKSWFTYLNQQMDKRWKPKSQPRNRLHGFEYFWFHYIF